MTKAPRQRPPLPGQAGHSGSKPRAELVQTGDPLPPGVLGINHYVTSERYLDERLGHCPGPPALAGPGWWQRPERFYRPK